MFLERKAGKETQRGPLVQKVTIRGGGSGLRCKRGTAPGKEAQPGKQVNLMPPLEEVEQEHHKASPRIAKGNLPIILIVGMHAIRTKGNEPEHMTDTLTHVAEHVTTRGPASAASEGILLHKGKKFVLRQKQRNDRDNTKKEKGTYLIFKKHSLRKSREAILLTIRGDERRRRGAEMENT